MNSEDRNASEGTNQSTLGSLREQAGEKVSQAADTLKQEAARREEGFRGSLSKQADQLASALRSAKSEIDPDSSIGRMFDYAADSVGSLAQSMKSTDTTGIVHGVRDFARERPGAFLGICALGGFAAARFLLASAPDGHRNGAGGQGGSSYSGSSSYPGSSSGSSYSGSSSRTHGTMGQSGGQSGSQARAMTAGMSSTGNTATGQAGTGQAGMTSVGSGSSGTGTGHGTTGTPSGGGLSGSGRSSTSTGGVGSSPTSSTTEGMSPASGTSGGIGGSGAGSEVGGDLSGQSAGTGGTSGTQGQSYRNAPAADRNGGRDV